MEEGIMDAGWEQLKYEDPKPTDKGILLSNQIHRFCQQGLLISDHYKQENLRPASYTLRIGDDYIDSDGDLKHFSKREDSFVFKKNSIVFVSIKESFNIPFYVVARFNLRVNWVYDGVLLGTGPQVDPGFSGALSCPLYNLTNADITIKREQNFATIDFEKTTNLLDGLTPEEKEETIKKAQDKHLVEVGDQVYSFYKASALKPLEHRKSHKMVSSLLEMREEVSTWRRLGVGSLIAFFGLTLSLLAFGANLYRQNADLSRQLADGRNELQQSKDRISKLEADLDRLLRNSNQNTPTSTVRGDRNPQPSQKVQP
jgi:deoxycytidine triphosphate deaminase/cell division protein FtsB